MVAKPLKRPEVAFVQLQSVIGNNRVLPMNLSSISAKDFVRIAKLLKSKDALLAKVAAIDAELGAFSGEPAKGARRGRPRKPAATAAPKAPRAKRGALKETVIALLKEAGPSGLSVKDLAAKTGIKGGNIHAWFFTTGKKIKEIQKVGKAMHAWVESATL